MSRIKYFKLSGHTYSSPHSEVFSLSQQKERDEIRKRLREVKELDGVFAIPRVVRPVFVTSYEIAMNDRAHFRFTLGYSFKSLRDGVINEWESNEIGVGRYFHSTSNKLSASLYSIFFLSLKHPNKKV